MPASYIQRHGQRFVSELMRFIHFATVSAQPRHRNDLKSCAAWLSDHLMRIGMENVKLISTRGHPIVYADWQHAPARPTVLIYGHYDVQPAEPFDQWQTPPFEPVVRDDYIYGRGACDNKGQMFTHIKALESYLRTQKSLPVNVKCLFEGEEEIGSPNLESFITRHTRSLAADVAVMSDTRMLRRDYPALTHALRGSLNIEFEVCGPGTDLHSGNFGGAIQNPLQVVCETVARLHHRDGRIAIPHFYDRVRRVSQAERDYMARVGPSNQQLLTSAKSDRGWGEPEFSLYERTTIRPSLSITGITGGYSGPGVKAVIPSRAVAKLNFRLVPDQKADEIERLASDYLARITTPGTKFKIRTLLKADAALVDCRHPSLRAAAIACRQSFGTPPVFLRSGGTIPVVNTFQKRLGISTVLIGLALPDDQLHAPNERFYLPNFRKGIMTSIRFLSELGKESSEMP